MKGVWLGFIAGLIALAAFFYASNAFINSSSFIFSGRIEHASAILSQVFGVVGLAWMLIYSVLSSELSKVKLIGSGLVLSLAFAANNVWTYGLSIFIVATLVTELQFLEKLAAMFTNRDKYWDYLAQKSTPEQAAQKAALEAVEAVQAEEAYEDSAVNADLARDPKPSSASAGEGGKETETQNASGPVAQSSIEGIPSIDSLEVNKPDSSKVATDGKASIAARTKNIIKFQYAAVDALKDYTNMLTGSKLLTDMRYSAPGVSFEVDAVLKTESIDYIVEVRHVLSPAALSSAVRRALKLVGLYGNLITAAGERKSVKGILIVPKGVWMRNRFGAPDLVVFELDQQLKKLKHVYGDWY